MDFDVYPPPITYMESQIHHAQRIPFAQKIGFLSNPRTSLSQFLDDDSYIEDDLILEICSKIKEDSYSTRKSVSELLGIEIPLPLTTSHPKSFQLATPKEINTTQQQQNSSQQSKNTSQQSENSSEKQKFLSSGTDVSYSLHDELEQNTHHESNTEEYQEEHIENEERLKEPSEFENNYIQTKTNENESKETENENEKTNSKEHNELNTEKETENKETHTEILKETNKSEISIEKEAFIRPSGFHKVKTNRSEFRYPTGYYAQRDVYSDMAPLGFSQYSQNERK